MILIQSELHEIGCYRLQELIKEKVSRGFKTSKTTPA